MYDMLIRGGHVIDPHHGIDAPLDIAIEDGRIAKVEAGIKGTAWQTLDATGMLVTPGLIDLHVHVHWGVSHYGIEADQCCLARGVTTVLEAGSAGGHTYPSLKRWIIDGSQTEIYALLNISYMGMIGEQVGELEDPRFVDADLAVKVAKAPEVLGFKVRLDRVGTLYATEVLQKALAMATTAAKPVMVHIGSEERMRSSLDEILALLRPGDVITHTYHGKDGGLLDAQGHVRAAAWEARQRGVIFDVAHGAGSFHFEVAQQALVEGFVPDTISSDLHTYSLAHPVWDLATTMTKFWHLGMALPEVVRAVTVAPARWMDLLERIGHLGSGADADVTLLRVEEGSFALYDCHGNERRAHRRLVPVTALKRGRLFGSGPWNAVGSYRTGVWALGRP